MILCENLFPHRSVLGVVSILLSSARRFLGHHGKLATGQEGVEDLLLKKEKWSSRMVSFSMLTYIRFVLCLLGRCCGRGGSFHSRWLFLEGTGSRTSECFKARTYPFAGEKLFGHHLVAFLVVVHFVHHVVDGGVHDALVLNGSSQCFQFIFVRISWTVEHVLRVAHALLARLVWFTELSSVLEILNATMFL